ncbi:sodium:solute symporter [Providencia rettgeri]|nr:sodium:solute symporter [Providencia rettgeri]
MLTHISISLAILFYYLEMVHEFFFRLYPKAMNTAPIFQHQTLLSIIFAIYLLSIAPLFFLCIKNKINNGYRFLFFIALPYILSVITWYFNIYISNPNHYSSSGSITGVFGHMFMASYVIHGVFFIPIVAYVADFSLRKILK